MKFSAAGRGRGDAWCGSVQADRSAAHWPEDSFSSSTTHIRRGSGPVRRRAENEPGGRGAWLGIGKSAERDARSADPTAAATALAARGPGSARRRLPAACGCRHGDGAGNKTAVRRRAGTARRSRRPFDDARPVATIAVFDHAAPNCGAPTAPSESRFHRETRAKRSAGGFFLMALQVWRIQWRTAFASRSMAWRWDFWGLQPRECKRRQT